MRKVKKTFTLPEGYSNKYINISGGAGFRHDIERNGATYRLADERPMWKRRRRYGGSELLMKYRLTWIIADEDKSENIPFEIIQFIYW